MKVAKAKVIALIMIAMAPLASCSHSKYACQPGKKSIACAKF